MTDPRLARYEAALPGRMDAIATRLSQHLPDGWSFGWCDVESLRPTAWQQRALRSLFGLPPGTADDAVADRP